MPVAQKGRNGGTRSRRHCFRVPACLQLVAGQCRLAETFARVYTVVDTLETTSGTGWDIT